jgi:glutamine amidotransferase
MNPTAGKPNIVIVDYGMGNIRSVHNALVRLGCSVRTSDQAADLTSADALILPGVGAFGEAVANLTARDLAAPILEAVRNHRKPLLGICLGMQLLAETS